MKKLSVVFLFFSSSVFAQNLGFNGAGFFENFNPQVQQWMHDWNEPFTLRVPGGAISKFTDPYNVRKGWGLTKQSIESWYSSVGFDEDGAGKNKWLMKMNEQPDRSYMDDLIALQKQFPNMQVIYVLNILNSNADANMNALRYMIKGGVNIIGVEAGNEVYGKYNSFAEYAKDFEPVFAMIRKEFPKIKLAISAAPYSGVKIKELWNEQMSAYKGDYDAAIVHFYYVLRDFKSVAEAYPEKTSTTDNDLNKQLDESFRKVAPLLLENAKFQKDITTAKSQFKGKEIWITEWNTKPSDAYNNTILNGAWQFKTMVEMRNQVNYLLVHNGVGPDKFGLISRNSSKYDDAKTAMVRRVGYWAFQMAGEVKNGIYLEKNKNYVLQKDDDNTVYYYFVNYDDAFKANISYGNYKIAASTLHYVSGKYIYSSAGWAGYMDKNQKPSYEINGIKVESFNGTIPKNAFGYIQITIQ